MDQVCQGTLVPLQWNFLDIFPVLPILIVLATAIILIPQQYKLQKTIRYDYCTILSYSTDQTTIKHMMQIRM